MYAVNLLEEAGTGAGSIWIPVVVLGWFLVMTLVGWQVSHRNAAGPASPQDAPISDSDHPPSEFDHH